MVSEEKEEERSWLDTPELILSNIQSRLFGRDGVNFSAVCKTWKTLPRFVREEDVSLSPCLIFHDGKRFFHPLHNTFFQLKSMPAAFPRGAVLAQNCGWLLMTRTNHPFFFNPLTNERMDLPYDRLPLLSASITFSSPPTSADCEIVRFSTSQDDDDEGDIVVNILKRGEMDFTAAHRITNSGHFNFVSSTPIYYKGEYYCIEKGGGMVIYNSKTNEHRLIESPGHLWTHFSAFDCRHHMFEGEGHLWTVSVACGGAQVCVLKLDSTGMVWEKVDDLGDRMVFLSSETSFMERSTVRETGNKIYFPRLRNNYCLFYCLVTKRYYASYKNFYESGSKPVLRCTWIRMNINPPLPITYEQKLVW